MSKILFEPYDRMNLKNRVVMAPMTRSRATADHIPTPLMAEYYGQRSGAGLIITEGTAPSPNGAGYPRIPGIYTPEQMEAWKPIPEAVHKNGAKIFLQLMHTGRISHPGNMPEGSRVLAPSAIVAQTTKMYVDGKGEQPLPTPSAMTGEDIRNTIAEYVQASEWAVEAGFDGVELHAANGYLIEQFLNPGSNQRTDAYGGSPANRNRFALEVAEAVCSAIGGDRTGIRLSPNGVFNDLSGFDGQHEQFDVLAWNMDTLGLTYLHLVNHEAMGAAPLPDEIRRSIRDRFTGTLILSGGYDAEKAERHLSAGFGNLVAFGRPFIANPDLVARMKHGEPLNDPDFDTFYTPGAKGYTDYPKLQKA
ncbi:alkene reductase [Robiginitalea sp. SC105]|uniref:alkene reductase n=1 Tax=Robiginitalea sp. SC105 TaxID=2762332 RepID=UPI00163A1C9F|nr:alkene reductase [Robiginitalea sp. SC105]MBC2839005.1 alkene reductase [Robiginitalea sp. SC105]